MSAASGAFQRSVVADVVGNVHSCTPFRLTCWLWEKALSVSLFALGIFAMAGIAPTNVVGWCTASFAFARFLAAAGQGKLKNTCSLIGESLNGSLYLILGVLAATGKATGFSVGYALVLIPIFKVPFKICSCLKDLAGEDRRRSPMTQQVGIQHIH